MDDEERINGMFEWTYSEPNQEWQLLRKEDESATIYARMILTQVGYLFCISPIESAVHGKPCPELTEETALFAERFGLEEVKTEIVDLLTEIMESDIGKLKKDLDALKTMQQHASE